MIEIQINGERRELAEGTTLAELLKALELSSRPIAVELNRRVVPRGEHGATMLKPLDALEIVTLVGGG